MNIEAKKKGFAFVLSFVAFLTVLFTGWQEAEPAYASVELKTHAIVIPVDFGGMVTQSGVSFDMSTANPRITYHNKAGLTDYYNLNDVYNSADVDSGKIEGHNGTPLIPRKSVGTYVKQATFGLNTIKPIYLSSDKSTTSKAFTPFSIANDFTPGGINVSSPWEEADYDKMEMKLNSVIQQVNANGALTCSTVDAIMPESINVTAGGVVTVSPPLDHVVFLVNASTGLGEYNPYKLRSYEFGAEKLEPLMTTVGEKGYRWKLRVRSYNVIFIDDTLPEILTHEAMHSNGVEDLFINTQNGEEVQPAGKWDIQSIPNFSGPYFTQRCHLTILKIFLRNGKITDYITPSIEMNMSVRDVDVEHNCHLYDINKSLLDVPKKEIIKELNERVCRFTLFSEGRESINAWEGKVDFWIEYRQANTDLSAGENGTLLIYTTFNSPSEQSKELIYLLAEINLDEVESETVTGYTDVNVGVQRGFITADDKISDIDEDCVRLSWALYNIVVGDGEVNFSYSLSLEPLSAQEITRVSFKPYK